MIIRITKDIEASKWKSILEKSDFSNPFQTPAFFELFNRQEGYCSEAFAVEEKGEYTCLLVVTQQKEPGLKAQFSNRAIIYGGPVILDNSLKSISYLIKFIVEHYKRRSIYLEFRNYLDYSVYESVYVQNRFKFLPYLNYRIPIEGKTMDGILNQMNYNRKREIRLSFENHVSYYEVSSTQDLEELYKILKTLYSKRVKLPIPSLEFFKTLSESELGKIFIVKHNNVTIGGSFCVSLPQQAIYTMYYCGIREYNKRIFPTHIAIYAAIEFALKNDIKYVDLMGAGIKDEEYGVRAYKQKFGGELNEYGRYRIILKPLMYKVGLIGLTLMKRIR